MFSVVIPFYNRASFFERILISLISQKEGLIEKIYIIDNGSSFEQIVLVSEIIRKYDGKYKFDIVVVSSIVRGNANPARNLGYILSDTDYVAFLDSDDWWDPNYLMSVHSFINENDFYGLYSGARIHLGRGNVLTFKSRSLYKNETPIDFLVGKRKSIAQTSSYVINKKKVGLSVLWDEHLTRHQDYDYFICFSRSFCWKYFDLALVNIDWDGNEIKPVDFTGVIKFYEKWRHDYSKETSIYYLVNQMISVVAKRDSNYFYDYFRRDLAKQGAIGYLLSIIFKRLVLCGVFKMKSFLKSLLLNKKMFS